MSLRKRRWKSVKAQSLSEAMELCIEFANEKRRPIKVLADLMGVEIKTLYRWLAETSMPLNRIRQFEEFCACSFISDYLCMAQGNKVVIDIPVGKKAHITELADVQLSFAEALNFLSRFYEHGEALDETVNALTQTLGQLAYQRSNVIKMEQPELELFGDANE